MRLRSGGIHNVNFSDNNSASRKPTNGIDAQSLTGILIQKFLSTILRDSSKSSVHIDDGDVAKKIKQNYCHCFALLVCHALHAFTSVQHLNKMIQNGTARMYTTELFLKLLSNNMSFGKFPNVLSFPFLSSSFNGIRRDTYIKFNQTDRFQEWYSTVAYVHKWISY